MRVGRPARRPGHGGGRLKKVKNMERDSFIFYKSFYEAIRDLPRDIRLEVYTAIMEYALYGRQPEELKPFAKGIFTLIKPNIDVNNARFENGKKGGRKPRVPKQAAPTDTGHTLTYAQEVERMRSDEGWRATVCADFGITTEEYGKRLSRFLERCNDDKTRKGKVRHDSYADCQSHFRYWMSKAYPQPGSRPSSPSINPDTSLSHAASPSISHGASPSRIASGAQQPSPDYSFKGGFGGQDV